jgi:hypothetical protein
MESVVQPQDLSVTQMTGDSPNGASPSIDDTMFCFDLHRGYEDPQPPVPEGGRDHAIMEELMLSIYEGQGLPHPESHPVPGQVSLDNHASMNLQLCGLTGDMDPYVLRHYRFDAKSEFAFSKLAIRTVQDTGVPVQFLLSKPDLRNAPTEGSLKLSHMVGPDIGERLIQL